MAGITGLGSGMDIDKMVSTLVSAEKAPRANQLSSLEKTTTTKISALGQLKGAVSSFRSSVQGLADLSSFSKQSVKSSDTSVLTIKADDDVQAGSWSVKVSQLAKGSKTATAALDSNYKTSAAGTLTVKLGANDSGKEVQIAAGATLQDIRDTLNESLKSSGMSANLITNPTDGKTRLVMSSTKTGEGNDVLLEASTGLESLSIGSETLDKSNAASSGVLEASSNAKFSVDGLELEKDSNTVNDAIPGVTLSLAKVDTENSISVSVGVDKSDAVSNVKKFVEAYNKLIGTTNSLTSVTKVSEDDAPVAGKLLGDASIRSLLSGIRNQMSNPDLQQGNIKYLADLGVTTKKDGTLELNETKLNAALDSNYENVANFIAGDNGFMKRMDELVSGYVKTGGVLEQRVKGLQQTLTTVDKQRESLDTRMEALEKRLYDQFNTMDSLYSQMTQTNTWLTQTLNNMPGFVKSSE